MPVQVVRTKGKDGVIRMIGFRWGSTGKVYLIRSFGKKEAFRKASKQGIAIKTNQEKIR